MTVDRERRVRRMSGEHQLDCLAGGGQRGIGQAALGKHRRKAGRDQERILLAERHVQPLGEAQHHFPARPRAAGLDEAEMPRRDLGLEGEIELAHAPPLAPAAQVMADRTEFGGHAGTYRSYLPVRPLPPA